MELMATSSLTPSDLDAIRLILREELEARERETVPPEVPAAEQPQRVALIIGNAYVARDGEIWDCIGCTGEEPRPMLCRERRSGLRQPFFTDGRWTYNRSNYDLVSRAPAEQPEWETVLGSKLREGDEVLVNGFPFTLVREIERCGTIRQFSLNRGSMNFDDEEKYTRRVRPKRPEWATQQSDATWLRSRIENPALLIQGGPYRTDGVAGELIRRLLPHVEAKARAMLAEVEAK